MKDQKIPKVKQSGLLFLSFLGIGYLPKAPGTFASLATLPLLYALARWQIPVVLLFPFFLICFFGACFTADYVQKKMHVHDPSWIVIDEVLGMTLTWFFWPSARLLDLTVAFLLFRFFDIVKVWPASYFDQKVHHGAGTILDDIVSGLYAGVIYYLLKIFLL